MLSLEQFYPKFCSKCGESLIKEYLEPVERFNTQTGEKQIDKPFILKCPKYSPITNSFPGQETVPHDIYQYIKE